MRIGIAGCAGTGKSLLAERLGTELGLPVLTSKTITSKILERDGYDYASGQRVEKFLSTPSRQAEILKGTKNQQSAESFIADRTAIDLAAYAILEMHDCNNVERHLDRCARLCERYTHIFFCSWENKQPADNGRRTLNPWYQFAVHSVELQVINMFHIDVCRLQHSEVDDRVREIVNIVQ